jgi:outer membrane protein
LRYTVWSVPALLLGAAICVNAQGGAPAPTKIGIINMQVAIGTTKDGQKASADLTAKFAPTKAKLEKRNADIEADRARLNQGSNAMSADQKEKLMRDIDQKTKALNREAEDAQAEVDAETSKIMQELGGRIMAVLGKYAKEKGYALVLDVSSQQSAVLVAPDDLTDEIVKLYDQNAPNPAASAPAPPPAPRAPATTPSPVKKAPAPKQ